MAKVTKEIMMKKLGALEDKLFDLIPEDEEGTSRVGILDRVSGIVSGEVKATLAEMTKAFNEGTGLLAVEAEVKKQTKAAKKAEESEVKEEPVEEESVEEEKTKKKVVMKKKTNKTAEPKEDKPAPIEKKEVSKKTSKKSEKEETFKFPEVLNTAEDGDYKQTNIRGLQDIEIDDLIACQWTKEDLAEYNYDEIGVFGKPTEFEQDIDVLMVVDVFEDKIVYASSLGTHKMYHFLKEDVKGMNSLGMPWRVYKPVA